MSPTYTTTNFLYAATDVGMHGLLVIVNRVIILCYPLVCDIVDDSSRFLHY